MEDSGTSTQRTAVAMTAEPASRIFLSSRAGVHSSRAGSIRTRAHRTANPQARRLAEVAAITAKGGSPTIENVPDESGPADLASRSVSQSGARPRVRGVITDWGGVLTNPILETVNAWIEAEGVDRDSYAAVMRPWVTQAYNPDGARNPIHALERGECTDEEFERLLASQLTRVDGGPVPADGLLARMFAATLLDSAMYGALRAIRRAGFRTALLSNSWGAHDYPRHLFPELFDAVVISSEAGMRKPEPGIFLHVTALLGLDPAECIFIDDIEANVLAAEAVGMLGVHHSGLRSTTERLSELLGIPLDSLMA